MKKIIKDINNLFVTAILIIFYFLIIGAAHLIMSFFSSRKKSDRDFSYWNENDALKINDFRSSY